MKKLALENVAGLDEPVHPQHELVEEASQTTNEGDACVRGSTLISDPLVSAKKGAQMQEVSWCEAGMAKVSEDKHVKESMDCTVQLVTSKANKFSRNSDKRTDTYSREEM